MSRMRNVLFAAFVAAAALPAASGQQGSDSVLRKDGVRESKVTVLSEDFDEVKYQTAEGPKTLKAEEVAEIDYGAAPRALAAGLDIWRRGDFERAAERLKEADESGSMGPSGGPNLLPAYLKFHLADCHQALATQDHCRLGARLFEGVLSDEQGGQSRFAFRAMLGLGYCRLGAGEIAQARSAFESLGSDPRLDRLPPQAKEGHRLRAQLGLADALAAEGKKKEAQAAYSSLLGTAASVDPELGDEIAILAAEMRIASGDVAAVRSEAESRIPRLQPGDDLPADGGSAAAVAHVSYAMALAAEKDYVRAKDSLARALVFFNAFPGSHAAALYQAGRLHRDLKESLEAEAAGLSDEGEKGAKETLAATAASLSALYFNRLVERHPRSRWARRYRSGEP
ncbi:MAG: hypothetical protein HY720_24810 [Planctomycetes bacterium]|nr:hypothetical protein [Planctomycetota bacterium]